MTYQDIQHELVKYKAYSAWPFFQSVKETMCYMDILAEVIKATYSHRKDTLKRISSEVIQKALDNPGKPSPLTIDHLKQTNLNIAGLEVNDVFFLRIMINNFFQYARISMDGLIQIANAALLGEGAYSPDDKGLIKKLNKILQAEQSFGALENYFSSIVNSQWYEYLIGYDDYLKHIQTVFIQIKNSIVLGDDNAFEISEFAHNGKSYPRCNVIDKVSEIQTEVHKAINDAYSIIVQLLPLSKNTANRIQELSFQQLIKNDEKSNAVESITFFLDVTNGLSDLPREVFICPIRVNNEGVVSSFDFQFDEIFIRRKTKDDEYDIIGCAFRNRANSPETMYKSFTIVPCTPKEYHMYLIGFAKKYPKYSINYAALAGTIVRV